MFRNVVMVGLMLLGMGRVACADPGDALDTGGGGVNRRYVLRAQILMEHGQYSDAIAYTQRALDNHPNYIWARFQHGRALFYSAKYDAAIDDFNEAIAAHPEVIQGYFFRGVSYLQLKKSLLAIADFNRGLAVTTDVGNPASASLYADRSLAFELLGKSEAAVSDFSQSLRLVSGNTNDWHMLTENCYNAAVVGLLDSALVACNESIKRHGRENYAIESRGLVYLKKKQWDLAIADYDQALYYKPDTSYVLYGRGIAKHAKGDKAGGDADIAAAVKLEPDIAGIMSRIGVQEENLVR